MSVHGFGPPLGNEILVKVARSQRNHVLFSGHRLRFFQRKRRLHGKPVDVDIAGIGRLPVADLETTLLDGLESPQLCGGLLEVCRFLAWRHRQWDVEKLVELAAKRDRAIIRRLGLLLDWAEDPAADRLVARVARQRAAPSVLDAGSPRRGNTERRWRVKVNLPREQVLEALRSGPAVSSAV